MYKWKRQHMTKRYAQAKEVLSTKDVKMIRLLYTQCK